MLVDPVLVDDLVLVVRPLVAGGRAVRPQVVRDRLPADPRVVVSR